MAKEAKKAAAPAPRAAELNPEGRLLKLEGDLAELQGDLHRIVELLVKGDLDSAKFREILDKRQGADAPAKK